MSVRELDERRVEAFLAPLAEIEPVSRRAPGRRLPLRAAFAIALVAAVAIVAVALPDENASPTAVLEDVARVAARQPIASSGSTYSKSLSKSRITFYVEPPWSVTVFETEELWLAADGSGRITRRYGPIHFPDERARAAWEEHDDAPIPFDRRFTLRPEYRDVEKLPRDPDRLLATIREEAERASSGKRGVEPYESFEHLLWARLTTLLGAMHPETNRRPRLRAAIFRAFANVDGAQLVGRMLDPLGREGIGIAFAVEGLRDVIVFHARTSMLLAFKTVVDDPERHRHYYDVNAGAAASWTAFYPPRRVRSLSP